MEEKLRRFGVFIDVGIGELTKRCIDLFLFVKRFVVVYQIRRLAIRTE